MFFFLPIVKLPFRLPNTSISARNTGEKLKDYVQELASLAQLPQVEIHRILEPLMVVLDKVNEKFL